MKGKFGILLAGGFIVLATISAATGNFAVRLELAARQSLPVQEAQAPRPQPAQPSGGTARQAQAPARPQQAAGQPAATGAQPRATAAVTSPAGSAIALQRIALTDRAATGFGRFQPRSSVIAPGTPFNIYFEPTNLSTRFENGSVRASMSIDILVRNARGQTVVARDNAWTVPVSRPSAAPATLTQVYGDLMLNHLTFDEGRYQIVLRIHDDLNGTFVDRVLDVELRRQATADNQRATQSTVAAQR
ncbi:MAG: hypothetical protein AB7O57_17275 [Hyphomicrobiaceae bacterium]